MKEELIKILDNKLDSINNDITSLKDLNDQIDEVSEESSFVDGIIKNFKEHEENEPLNFDKIIKEDFERSLDIAGDEVKNLFNSSACNYDGLVYLISGIKSGVSISLTNEQLNGIEYFIQTLTNKKTEMDLKINELEQNKEKYLISDINELKVLKEKYEKVVDEINNNGYIKEIDLLKEAITFANIPASDTINVLSYVLEYNADLYKENKPIQEEKEIEEETQEVEETNDDINVQESVLEDNIEFSEENTDTDDNEFHFNQVENDNLFDLPNITFDDETKEDTNEEVSESSEDTLPQEELNDNEDNSSLEEEQKLDENQNETIKNEIVDVVDMENTVPLNNDVQNSDIGISTYELPPVDEKSNEIPFEEITPVSTEEIESPVIETVNVEEPEIPSIEASSTVDDDFKNVIDEKNDYETRETQEAEKTSTRELHKLFDKYGVEENVILNELVDGDINQYQNILDLLKDNKILDLFKKNKELLAETLINSDTIVIDKVLKIVKEDLSVDDEDYEITLKIVIDTIPSIFVREGGNYDNFIQNVQLFKTLGINLINLFDFSKELFVADHELIENNLEIINKYGFDIDYKNAKYFLMIPFIAEKLDYYIESIYQDKLKNETFDGIKYIKEYAPKLNVVTDETIKRLRYASTNGMKVFGSKPGSLSGEITNLKVHSLGLNDEYLNGFFNNQFNDISQDEVREYVKLTRNSSNVGNYEDELDILDQYHDGLRYVIEGINVSYYKVQRIYSILRSYGINSKKALHFAVCYNLVITKEEYNKLDDLLSKIGGNI